MAGARQRLGGDRCVLLLDREVVEARDGCEHLARLRHQLRPDSVAGEARNRVVAAAHGRALFVVGVAVLFLLRLETNLKRRRAHGVLHELRSLAHVIDMHQLAKDPAGRRLPEPEITESPKGAMTPASLGRYLDYCTDLLSLTGKLSALLVQRFKDDAVLGEVNEIEALASALSGRIWQKIQLLEGARTT